MPEWMLSIPGSEDDKLNMINCVSCHTHERIVKSNYDADAFVQVISRMNSYAQVSKPAEAAAARRPVAGGQSGTLPQAGRVPRHHQPEPKRQVGLRPQELPRVKAAAQRHHHRIRPAAAHH